jgi:hypothetical protein
VLTTSDQVAGRLIKEIEIARTALIEQWLGVDMADIMTRGGRFFEDMGGYKLPEPR